MTNKGGGCAENGSKMEMTSYQKGDRYIKILYRGYGERTTCQRNRYHDDNF